jgi:hypothetical protein
MTQMGIASNLLGKHLKEKEQLKSERESVWFVGKETCRHAQCGFPRRLSEEERLLPFRHIAPKLSV